MNLNEGTRAWIYRVALAVGVLLVAYGVISDAQADVWLQVILAVLAIAPSGLASANTSTK